MRTPQPPQQIPQDTSQLARDAWATAVSTPTEAEPSPFHAVPSADADSRRSDDPGDPTGPTGPKTPRLRCVALEKSYRKGDLVIPVLRGVDLEVASGEFLSVSGQSG